MTTGDDVSCLFCCIVRAIVKILPPCLFHDCTRCAGKGLRMTSEQSCLHGDVDCCERVFSLQLLHAGQEKGIPLCIILCA